MTMANEISVVEVLPAKAAVSAEQQLRQENEELKRQLHEHAEVIARLVWLKNHGHIAVMAQEGESNFIVDPSVRDCMSAWPKAQEMVKQKMWREKQQKDVAWIEAGGVDAPTTVK